MNKLYIIGIGFKPLTVKVAEIVRRADRLLASSRLHEVFRRYEEYEGVKDKVLVLNNINDTLDFIRENLSSRKIVLLASGDPMFFGIGRRVINEFGKDMVGIIPDISSIQLAFSRIKEPWDNAFLMSLHGGPDPEKRRRLPYELRDIPELLVRFGKIGVLTDKENNPAAIAREVVSGPVGYQSSDINIFVCERLGYPDERIVAGSPEEIAEMSFSGPNVVIIQKTGDRSQRTEDRRQKSEVKFGLGESEIRHSRGLITKDEIRAVAIHKLRLPQEGVFWDIGAGSGSVSLEAARLCPDLRVFAVEKDGEQVGNITANRTLFGSSNVEVIGGEAPGILNGLPSPDRIFVGGNGGVLGRIMEFITRTPAGIIVVNATTIETLNSATEGLKKAGFGVEVSQISVSRARSIGDNQYLASLNPVFVIRGTRI